VQSNNDRVTKIDKFNRAQTFESVAGYRELEAPRRQVLVELAVQFLIETELRVVLRRVIIFRGSCRVSADRYVIVDPVHGVVVDGRVENLEGATFEAVEGVLLVGAALEQPGELILGGREVA